MSATSIRIVNTMLAHDALNVVNGATIAAAGTGQIRLWYANSVPAAGNVTEDVIHFFVYAVWKNPDSGRSVIEQDHLMSMVPPDDQGFLELGLNFHLSLPSGGTVLIDAGKLHFDNEGNLVFEAGNHQFEDGDFGALCAALS